MTTATVRSTGTIARVSPRAAEKLSAHTRTALQAARHHAQQADRQFKQLVSAACDEASVRVVADALGLSPTTVQKWKTEADR